MGDVYCTKPECKWTAWTIFTGDPGIAMAALAREVNKLMHPERPSDKGGPHNGRWAKRAINSRARAAAEVLDHGVVESRTLLLRGLREDLKAQEELATGATRSVRVWGKGEDGKFTSAVTEDEVPDNAVRSLARRRVTELRLKEAEVLGVPTRLPAQEIRSFGGRADTRDHDAGDPLEELVARLARLADCPAPGEGPADGHCEDEEGGVGLPPAQVADLGQG